MQLKLKIADKLLVCGQALSHCVNFTCRDLVAHFDDMKVFPSYLPSFPSFPNH